MFVRLRRIPLGRRSYLCSPSLDKRVRLRMLAWRDAPAAS